MHQTARASNAFSATQFHLPSETYRDIDAWISPGWEEVEF
jgi:hypothetical protein